MKLSEKNNIKLHKKSIKEIKIIIIILKSGFISLNSSSLYINVVYFLFFWYELSLFSSFSFIEIFFKWVISDLFKYLVIGIKIPQHNSPKKYVKQLINGSF